MNFKHLISATVHTISFINNKTSLNSDDLLLLYLIAKNIKYALASKLRSTYVHIYIYIYICHHKQTICLSIVAA